MYLHHKSDFVIIVSVRLVSIFICDSKLISDNACIPSIVGMVGSEISNHMDISVIDLVFVIQSQSSQTQRLI